VIGACAESKLQYIEKSLDTVYHKVNLAALTSTLGFLPLVLTKLKKLTNIKLSVTSASSLLLRL